ITVNRSFTVFKFFPSDLRDPVRSTRIRTAGTFSQQYGPRCDPLRYAYVCAVFRRAARQQAWFHMAAYVVCFKRYVGIAPTVRTGRQVQSGVASGAQRTQCLAYKGTPCAAARGDRQPHCAVRNGHSRQYACDRSRKLIGQRN
ncbi:hypothetical protein AVEN_171902-1, partial [Araneus ventricosus]